MRIISKFKDYYDMAQGFGYDPSVVYVRTSKKFDYNSSDKTLKQYEDALSDNHAINYVASNLDSDERVAARYQHIVICGKAYTVFAARTYANIDYNWKKWTSPVMFFGSFLEMQEKFPYKNPPKDNSRYYPSFYDSDARRKRFGQLGTTTKDRWSSALTNSEAISFDWSVINQKYNSPIVVIASDALDIPIVKLADDFCTAGSPSDRYSLPKAHTVWTDIEIGNLGISKIIDPYQMHQAIDTWISSNNVKEIVEVSNTSKIKKAGFDMKQSFRHRT